MREIRPLLPKNAQVRSGEAQAQQSTKETNGFLSIIQDFLLAFGGVALFVGSFVIANTLSITIAQRTRELATLRTLGATRRQVLRSVMLEAFVIGLIAAVAGLFLGPRPRQGTELAVRVVRHRPAAGFDRVRHQDDHRLAARGRRDHAARGTAPGDPRDPRAADLGGARGLAAGAVALRALQPSRPARRSRWLSRSC